MIWKEWQPGDWPAVGGLRGSQSAQLHASAVGLLHLQTGFDGYDSIMYNEFGNFVGACGEPKELMFAACKGSIWVLYLILLAMSTW